MFRSHELSQADAAVSYPLVSCRYPGLSLTRWVEFVGDTVGRGNHAHLVGLVDQRGRIHAIFGYRLESDGAPRRLLITHIATFRLAGNEIYRAFDRAVEQIARENGCREIAVRAWGGTQPGDGPTTAAEDVASGHRLLTMEGAAPAHQLSS
ncbi:MAG: hypothetical protein U1E28_12000 [Beijerinckiaceae bacterium]